MVSPAQRSPPIEELIGDIYEAALSPDRWNHFLDRLSASLSDSFLLLGIIDRHAANSVSLGMSGLSAGAIQDYRKHFIRVNPWIGALSSAPLGQPVVVRDLADDTAVQRGEFFQDWLRHQPAQHPTSLLTALKDGRRLCLTVVHHGTGPDRSDLGTLLRTLAPHMTRAVQMTALRAAEPARHAADAATFDMLSVGVIHTDGEGRVMMTNALAEEILRAADGLRYGIRGRLTAAYAADTERLHGMIRGAAAPGLGGSNVSGGTLSLARGRTAGRMAILVAPLPPSTTRLAGGTARVALFIRRDEDRARLDVAGLAPLLDLTATEAAIAALLAEGASLADIAATRDVSVGTVRGQVKAILTKTGTHSQIELVRLLMQSRFPLR
jgi:DNA-binding CsgD family transcriptional regulator/PAS domain-containing protein